MEQIVSEGSHVVLEGLEHVSSVVEKFLESNIWQ